MREHTCLLAEDYRDIGLWILGQTTLSSKQFAAHLESVKKARLAKWHIFGAPDDVVHPDMKTLEAVTMLTNLVPSSALTNSNWGGRIWNQLKDGIMRDPGWTRLQKTPFWEDHDKYMSIHTTLAGKKATLRTDPTTKIAVEKGTVHQVQLSIGDSEAGEQVHRKSFMMGPPLSVLAVGIPSVIICELDYVEDDHGPPIRQLAEYDCTVPIIAMGSSHSVTVFEKMINNSDVRRGQTRRRMIIYVDDEPAFGNREDHTLAKDIHVLFISSSTKLPNYRPYMVCRGVGLLPEHFDYLFGVIGLQPTTHCRHALWVPNTTRTCAFVQERLACMIVRQKGWSTLLGVWGDYGDKEVFLAGLTKCITMQVNDMRAEDIEQQFHDHVLNLIRRGDTVSVESLRREKFVEKSKQESEKPKTEAPEALPSQSSPAASPAPKAKGGKKKKTDDSTSAPAPAAKTPEKTPPSQAAAPSPKPKREVVKRKLEESFKKPRTVKRRTLPDPEEDPARDLDIGLEMFPSGV